MRDRIYRVPIATGKIAFMRLFKKAYLTLLSG